MPAIEVSCPACGELNIIDMEIRAPLKGGVMDFLSHMIDDMGIKQYAFTGEKKCIKCGENIDVAVNVATNKKKEGKVCRNMQVIQL